MDPEFELDLHCLLKRLKNVSADNKNERLFMICALRVLHGFLRILSTIMLKNACVVCGYYLTDILRILMHGLVSFYQFYKP